MTTPAFEAFLAKVYVDPEFRARFLENPRHAACQAGLSEAECLALEGIDREGLALAANSFAAKRKKHVNRWASRWRRFLPLG